MVLQLESADPGWMIQAIESNYDVPASYPEHRDRAIETQKLHERQVAINACGLCDPAGFRYLTSEQYPHGAMRRCAHDVNLEPKITADAQNSTDSDQKNAREENDL